MRRIPLILLGVILFSCFSCKKEIIKTLGKADIIGYANTREDTYFHPFELEASNVKVTLLSGSGSYTTTTDETGKYVFPDIPFGDYRLKFEKESYNTTYTNLTHIGEAPSLVSSRDYPVNIFEQPHYKIAYCSNLSFSFYSESSYNWFNVNIGFEFENDAALPNNVQPLIYAYYGRTPDVDSANYEFYTSNEIYLPDINQSAEFELYLYSQDYSAGDKWYVKLYPANVSAGDYVIWNYTNPDNLKRIVTCLGNPFKKLITITVY